MKVSSLRLNCPPTIYHCEPGWSWSPPPLPDWDLWCVASGEGTLQWADGPVFPLVSDTCFVIPRGASPVATQNPRRRLVVFFCHFEPLEPGEESIEWLALPPAIRLRRNASFLWHLADKCVEAGGRNDALGREQARLGIAQILLHLHEQVLVPTLTPEEARLHETLRAMRTFPGRDWSVDVQATQTGLPRTRYIRLFDRVTGGDTPTQFVVRVRLERACQLIRETDMTLTRIAEALGYRDLFYFSRQFKKRYGVSPGAFRSPEFRMRR